MSERGYLIEKALEDLVAAVRGHGELAMAMARAQGALSSTESDDDPGAASRRADRLATLVMAQARLIHTFRDLRVDRDNAFKDMNAAAGALNYGSTPPFEPVLRRREPMGPLEQAVVRAMACPEWPNCAESDSEGGCLACAQTAEVLGALAYVSIDECEAGTGASSILAERWDQVFKGYDAEHDMRHAPGGLLAAAICYAERALLDGMRERPPGDVLTPTRWSLPQKFAPSCDPIRNLVVAGALIAAEIDLMRGTSLKPAQYGAAVSAIEVP